MTIHETSQHEAAASTDAQQSGKKGKGAAQSDGGAAEAEPQPPPQRTWRAGEDEPVRRTISSSQTSPPISPHQSSRPRTGLHNVGFMLGPLDYCVLCCLRSAAHQCAAWL